ncbi:MAG: azurin [Marinirhabdus sp.]
MINFKAPALLFAALLLLSSCGEGTKKEEKETMTIGTAPAAKKNDDKKVNVPLTGNDLMQFNKKEIRVRAGQEVTLTLTHVGKQELLVMGHNFVLLKPDTDINAFAQEAAAVGKDGDWIPNDGENVIAHTKMIGGGQSTSVTFTAPAPGSYDFICSFSGHAALMQGKFIVE